MKRLIAGALVALAAPAGAEATLISGVSLHARSGTVAPTYAWSWDVTFKTDGSVLTRYCKGYAETEPGCASREDRLTDEQTQALFALTQSLTSAPENPNPPIGGGATWATIGAMENPGVTPPRVMLPAHPLPEDQARVTAALDALAAFIPPGALDETASKAKAP